MSRPHAIRVVTVCHCQYRIMRQSRERDGPLSVTRLMRGSGEIVTGP